MAAADWQQITEEILRGLDIQREYEALGVEVTGHQPNSKGWVKCRAPGRADRNPSSEINIGEPPGRGRYCDWTTGERLSFFDFAARYGPYPDWQAARKHYAEQAGVKLPKGRPKKRVEDSLAFQAWNPSLAAAWCRHKPPITPDALRLNGGRLAKWPKNQRQPYPVAVIPVFGAQLLNADPTGWVAWHRGGRELPIFQGKGRPPLWTKMKTLYGSRSGWLGAYGLANLEAAEIIWKIEGPVDMLGLFALIPEELRERHLVITNASGASEIPQEELIEHLSGKTVYVVHDADYPGQGIPTAEQDQHRVFGARLWCREIAKYALEVRNVQLPYEIQPNHGKDVRDYFNEGHTYADLLAIAEQTPVFDPPPDPPPSSSSSGGEYGDLGSDNNPEPTGGVVATQNASGGSNTEAGDGLLKERHILAQLQIDVLGEIENGKIKIFSVYHKKAEVIRDITRWKHESILQFCGPAARTAINTSGEWVPGKVSVQDVRDAVSMVAGYRRLGKHVREVGRGVWRGRTDKGEANDTIVLVGSREAARINGEAQRIEVPRVDGLLLDIGENDEAWYQFDRLNEYLQRCRDPKWTEAVVGEMDEIFRRWRWRERPDAMEGISALTCTGLVLSTWVQTLWRWRPQVAIIGSSNTGKTMLCEMLGGNDAGGQGLFGGLSMLSSQSSEAGIRQAIHNTAVVLICDEFEDSKDRAKILNLFRTTGRGAKILRGSANQKSETFGLQHIPWVAAIGVGLKREPDRNRFITLELTRPADREHGKLQIPDEDHLVDLGQRLLAIAITHVREAADLAVKLKSVLVPGIDKRVVENYAVPAAMIAVATQRDGEMVLCEMLKLVDPSEQGQSDEIELLRDITTAHIDCGRGERFSVGQILASDQLMATHYDSLERCGIGTVTKRRTGEKRLFIAHKTVLRDLLRGSDWADVDQILSRLPDAAREKQKLGGSLQNGIAIPYDWVAENMLNEQDDAGDLVGDQKRQDDDF